MTDQLISFETAKLAKKKGLDTQLDESGNCMVYHLDQPDKNATPYHVHFTYPSRDEYLYAPTQSLLQKWLREKHKLHIEVFIGFNNKFGYYIHDLNIKDIYDRTKARIFIKAQWDIYEDALEIAEQEALKLIKT